MPYKKLVIPFFFAVDSVKTKHFFFPFWSWGGGSTECVCLICFWLKNIHNKMISIVKTFYAPKLKKRRNNIEQFSEPLQNIDNE